MSAPPVPTNSSVPSIQTVYTLYEYTDEEHRAGAPILHCKNVIKIPIAEPVAQQIGINTYTVIPCTALVIENDSNVYFPFKIYIETNEGVIVEPIIVHAPIVRYDTAYLLYLPRGTTGIKKAYMGYWIGSSIFQNDLVFDIMEAPYNYENYLHALNYTEFERFRNETNDSINEQYMTVHDLGVNVKNLELRVKALENKVGG